VEREKEQNFLKTPLTLVLSRKGKEEMEGKNLKAPPILPSPAGWRGWIKGEKGMKKEFT